MRRVLCSELPRTGHPTLLEEAEAQHLVRVLRLGDGDRVEAIDGKGSAITARLQVRGREVRLFVIDEHGAPAEHRGADALEVVPVILEIAALKGEAMEWVVEKAVELGVQEVHPVITANTVVQLGRKTPEDFRERWQKIADQALKQCGRLIAIRVEPPRPLSEMLTRSAPEPKSLRLWCDEASRSESVDISARLAKLEYRDRVRLLVGPEGGWSDLERGLLQVSVEAVSLGPLVLRAETAALYATSLAISRLRSLPSSS